MYLDWFGLPISDGCISNCCELGWGLFVELVDCESLWMWFLLPADSGWVG